MIALTIRHLRYFEALTREGHFGRAARACGISQPALSVQIRELEAMIGAPLFERQARQIRLTALGEDFLARARKILVDIDELDDLIRSGRRTLSGRLRLGVIPTVAPYLLPELIRALSAQRPGLMLEPRETVTSQLIADLVESRLDAAIVALPVSEPALSELPLFEEEFVLLRPKADADKPVPSPEHLREMRLMLLGEGHCFRDQALRFCGMADAKRDHVMEGSSLTTLVQMVGAGMGLTLVPDMALPLETRSAPVSVARFPPPAPSRTIGLVWRRTSPLAGQLKEIGDIVRAVRAKEEGERVPLGVAASR